MRLKRRRHLSRDIPHASPRRRVAVLTGPEAVGGISPHAVQSATVPASTECNAPPRSNPASRLTFWGVIKGLPPLRLGRTYRMAFPVQHAEYLFPEHFGRWQPDVGEPDHSPGCHVISLFGFKRKP